VVEQPEDQEPIAEVTAPAIGEQAEAATAPTLESMPSADDALARPTSLAADKEDQSRAEAEQAGGARMAAIMGRKSSEMDKLAEQPSVSAVPPQLTEEMPAEAPAAVEAQAENVESIEPDQLVEAAAEQIAPEESADWLSQLTATTEASSVAEPTPLESLPEWLRAMQPAAETEETSVFDEASDRAGEVIVQPAPLEELPDWLAESQPETAEAALSAEASAEPAPGEELPAWLQAMQPEPVASTAESIEVETVVEESQPEVPSEPEALMTSAVIEPEEPRPTGVPDDVTEEQPIERTPQLMSLSWWVQSAEDEDEQPLTDLPEPVKMATAPRVAPAAQGQPAATRAPRERFTERDSRAARRGAPSPAPIASVNVDPLLAQLATDKYNRDVRLDLARAWWSMGNRESAMDEYAKLINPAKVEGSDEDVEELDFTTAGPLADEVINDLERIVEIDDDPNWSRLLGDIHMQTGNLARALEMYRRALSQL
jgi:hypothetical protein